MNAMRKHTTHYCIFFFISCATYRTRCTANGMLWKTHTHTHKHILISSSWNNILVCAIYCNVCKIMDYPSATIVPKWLFKIYRWHLHVFWPQKPLLIKIHVIFTRQNVCAIDLLNNRTGINGWNNNWIIKLTPSWINCTPWCTSMIFWLTWKVMNILFHQ